MRPILATTLAGACFFGAPAFGQGSLPFPLDVTTVDPALETVHMSPDYDMVSALMSRRSVRLSNVFLPGGELIDVDLVRLSVERRKFGFNVDGLPRPDLLDGLDLSIWRGEVAGDPHSSVMLSFSRSGCHGWIQRENSLVHLMPEADMNGDWHLGGAFFVTERSLNRAGMKLDGFCSYDQTSKILGESTITPGLPAVDPTQPNLDSSRGTCTIRECPIAFETDYQCYQVWNNLGAMTTYITTMLTFSSDRYETQVNTVLTFPYMQFYTNSNDPWSAQDGSASCIDVLYELQAAWAGNIPGGARIAHLYSGASLGCGVAWLDVLCDNTYNFSVSGNVNGNLSFPIVQQPNNWDFIVFTHELGHNFGSPHTHDFCPPLDECAPSGYFGQCQNSQVCTSSGTVMSYCHLCSGGTANITTYVHPPAAAVMTNGANNCLDLYSGIEAYPPSIVSNTTTTPVSADIAGTVVGTVDLNYRYNGGSYSSVAMTNTGGNTYTGDLPIAACGDSPEFYVSFTEATCGLITAPVDAPNTVFTAPVGTPTVAFADNFETNTGWTTQNLGATSGDWERGVPVNDAGWDYDPATDGDGSGSCYLTQNQVGNTDVDNGAVRLFSPVLDMSGGDPVINYSYYLRMTNSDGTDKLLVEISSNGAAGPWATIANHNTDGSTTWRDHVIDAADLSAASVNLTSTMMMRFTANDDGTQSIVEAGLDGFIVSTLDCGADPGPTAYCDPANANSFSPGGAVLSHVSGDPGGLLTLQVDSIPSSPGLFYHGTGQSDLPFGCGRRCVVGNIVRSHVFQPGANSFQAVLDTTGSAPSPFNIQYWFRDPSYAATCGSTFNTSNALGY